MNATVRVTGLRELDYAFRKVNTEASKGFRKELMTAAEPVAASARGKISRYGGANLGTIHPIASAKGVAVVQDARKVTGKRGDYGSLQLRRMGEALDENSEKVVVALELALDRLSESAGF